MKIHIPTEQYGFVEAEVESAEEARLLSDEVKYAFETQEGLDSKRWNKCLERYLTEKTMEADDYTLMSPEQVRVIQEIKRAYARLKNK